MEAKLIYHYLVHLPIVGLSSSEETATRGIVGCGILIADRTVFLETIGDESLSFWEESDVDSAPCTLILDLGVLKIQYIHYTIILRKQVVANPGSSFTILRYFAVMTPLFTGIRNRYFHVKLVSVVKHCNLFLRHTIHSMALLTVKLP